MPEERYIQVILPLLLDWEPYYSLPEGVESLVAGSRVRVVFASRHYVGVVSVAKAKPSGVDVGKVRPIEGVETGLPCVSESELRFWREIADYYLCPVGMVYKVAYPSLKTEGELVESRQVERLRKREEALAIKLEKARPSNRERYRSQLEAVRAELRGESVPVQAGSGIELSPKQQRAEREISAAFERGKTALLDGVTGSGKTEIYLKMAAECLQKGKSVLYLVPEIALSRQLEERIREHFPGMLTYHSRLTASRRSAVASTLRKGGANLVLGTRSALFLPFKELGLIIVDEEHDRSYKQDSPSPRYNAREAAIMLAGIHGANVLLGSATPSLESLYNANKELFVKVDLKERFYKADDAEIEIIDTVAERRKKGMHGALSFRLIKLIGSCLESGKQAVLLRSRRSYAPAVQCTECGYIPRCPSCNVSLSLHKGQNGAPDRLLCHYCGHSEPYSATCEKCGASLQPLGFGTQRVEEDVRECFPTARVARLDSDSTGEDVGTIKSFERGDIDILIGTQIVTKGFDFGNVALVAVIQADNVLGLQDFRADERALQLLEQFRGRCGRRGASGQFVIQTREPSHPVFRCLKENDNASALTENMLAERQAFSYPPFTRLIHVDIHDSNEKRLYSLSQALAAELSACGMSGVTLVGPYAPSHEFSGGEYCRQIRLMLPRNRMLRQNKALLLDAVRRFETARRYTGHISLDVDPA